GIPETAQGDGNDRRSSEELEKFKENYQLYVTASGCYARDKPVQAAVLLHCVGEEPREIIKTLELSPEEMRDPDQILMKLDAHFVPASNVSIERHKFNTRVQQPQESFDNFLKDLKKITAECEFASLKDGLIKDRIVCGINDARVKERLLREANLDLNKAVLICRAAEQSQSHIQQLSQSKETVVEVNELRRNMKTGPGRNSNKRNNAAALSAGQSSSDDKRGSKMESSAGASRPTDFREQHVQSQPCGKCGKKHKS
ncbi:hypothetical protein BDFB_002824, partial [Asbolus verrucosus]